MKIRMDKDIVEFTPEHAAEAAELEALWIKMGNCLGGNKSLEPLGVYVPAENKTATFHIAGLSEEEKKSVGFRYYGICHSSVLYSDYRGVSFALHNLRKTKRGESICFPLLMIF